MTDEPVKRSRARAVNNHDEREADGQQMIFKAFALPVIWRKEPETEMVKYFIAAARQDS